MKKLFIAVLAVAALASCAQDEIITKHNQVAIGFGNAYVDNSTKAIITAANEIQGFTVWGNVQGTGVDTPVALYGNTGAAVTREGAALGAAWKCGVVRYWTAACDYNFVAIANGTGIDVVNGLPTKISYTVKNDPADLLYGVAAAKTTDENVISGDVVTGTGTGTVKSIVAFSLNHLLSRVKVSFQSKLAADATDYRYTITDVKVVTPESGTYTIADNKWALATTNANLPFTGTEQIPNNSTVDYGAQLVIPTSQVNLVFTYALELKTGVDALSGEDIWTPFRTETVTKTGIVTPVKNCSYNITVVLQAGAKIDFTVKESGGLTDFTPGDDVNVQ